MHARPYPPLFPLPLEAIDWHGWYVAFRVTAAATFTHEQMPFDDANGFLLAVTSSHIGKDPGLQILSRYSRTPDARIAASHKVFHIEYHWSSGRRY